MSPAERFRRARDLLWTHRENLELATQHFAWPALDSFNWVRDHFDVIARDNASPGLRVVQGDGRPADFSFEQLRADSTRLSNALREWGILPGDRVLLMLPNVPELWLMTLALIRIGAVMVPASTLLRGSELDDRLERAQIRAIVTMPDLVPLFAQDSAERLRIVSGVAPGWRSLQDAETYPDAPWYADTHANDSLLLYFTSGTTSAPKLVEHTHQTYPVGHLSTMYWLGLRRGDTHLNLSSPGWAKHAWSSFFAPWNAEACVVAYQYDRFDAAELLRQLGSCQVTSLCAPPTVWRLLVQESRESWPGSLRELASAGEPLNPELIDRIRELTGLTVRDGFGQTETTAQVANSPGQRVIPGAMGRPLPGYTVVLLDGDGQPSDEGEIALPLARRPAGLMRRYVGSQQSIDEVETYYRTGDIARRDGDGYLHYIGRADDLFKCSDYRISPFELESILQEHPGVAESAVVPSPDSRRGSVPKAFVTAAPGFVPGMNLAVDILRHVAERTSPFRRVRRIEFAELPKTVSGKIKRAELKRLEAAREAPISPKPQEFWDQ